LQWPTVLVLGLGQGLMPIASAQTRAAIEEERRLLYVALTRSEEELWCSWFERSGDGTTGGAVKGPSPWLEPIERAVVQLQKEAAPTSATEVSARVDELRRRLAAGVEGTDAGR
jgi:superfamily I DNA/RNA helicase